MSVALPVTQPADLASAHNDPRHYTQWKQVRAPQRIAYSPSNPLPEDPGKTY